MIALRDDQRKKILLKVDGESILFFAGLFMMIGGLEKVHLFETLAKYWRLQLHPIQMPWCWPCTGDRVSPAEFWITFRWRWR